MIPDHSILLKISKIKRIFHVLTFNLVKKKKVGVNKYKTETGLISY